MARFLEACRDGLILSSRAPTPPVMPEMDEEEADPLLVPRGKKDKPFRPLN